MMLENLLGIIIILFILGICFLMMYWGFNQIYKNTLKSKKNSEAEVKMEIAALIKRVELLERKLDSK